MNLWLMIFGIIALIIGGDVWLYFVAFGDIRCSGGDMPAIIVFTFINSVIFLAGYTLAIQALDIFNDMQADSAASKNVREKMRDKMDQQEQEMGLVRRQAQVLSAQYEATQRELRLRKQMGNESGGGGMVIDSGFQPSNSVFGDEE